TTLRSFFFFLYRCAAHHALHSFPTRRSSDLALSGHEGGRRPRGPVRLPRPSSAQARLSPPLDRSHQRRGARPPAYLQPVHSRLRSEEHTSELQSPCNLVCRLLLEKKKNKQTN